MEVIPAPNRIHTLLPTVFLAGGITNCREWQNEVIDILKPYTNAVLLNPRRENFPIDVPNAALEQITWEFNALNDCDIFSMWFCAGESVQPICMYELGRHLVLKSPDRITIGIEPGYKRTRDVIIQTRLINKELAERISISLFEHAMNIQMLVCKIPRFSH